MSVGLLVFLMCVISWPIVGVLSMIIASYLNREEVTLGDITISIIWGWIIPIVGIVVWAKENGNSLVIFDFREKNEDKES